MGRRIQIRREKVFWTTPWARTSHINIFNYKPSTDPGSGPKNFFSTDSNSATQNYPKTTYWKSLLIYTCPSTILQIQIPLLVHRVTWCLFPQQIRILHPKITLEWYIDDIWWWGQNSWYFGPLAGRPWLKPWSDLFFLDCALSIEYFCEISAQWDLHSLWYNFLFKIINFFKFKARAGLTTRCLLSLNIFE